jgi:hypothetical protein
MNEATRIAQQILDEQGYVVFAFHHGPDSMPAVGDIVNKPIQGGRATGVVPGPFRIIGTAMKAEFIAQASQYSPYGDEFAKKSAETALAFFKAVAE